MTIPLYTIAVGELQLRLVECRGNYTLILWLSSEPGSVCITHLGNDRRRAVAIYTRKVVTHQMAAEK